MLESPNKVEPAALKVVSLAEVREARAEKLDIQTPRRTLEQALAHVDEYEQVIVIALRKDGEVMSGWSVGSLMQAIGTVEAAKSDMLDERFGDE